MQALHPDLWIDAQSVFKSVDEVSAMTYPYVTDDRLFGYRAHFKYEDFMNPELLASAQKRVKESTGFVLVYGQGATLIAPEADLYVYADMPRWEIQLRSRKHEINGLGVENKEESASKQYKRGYFVDWIVCDNLKKKLLPKADYWLDTTLRDTPKMITGDVLRKGLEKTAHKPFRVVPFFDPAPWGGQWMKAVCGLDPGQSNYGWCFDCVPEENSLYLRVEGTLFEMPANNLVFYKTRDLLGAPVESRFGQDFPIRFDFLDTIGGGNLSLQVHPTTQYIRDTFGIYYTQDESYYLLDAEEGATVFLGLKTGVNPEEMISALNEAQDTGNPFDAENTSTNRAFLRRWMKSIAMADDALSEREVARAVTTAFDYLRPEERVMKNLYKSCFSPTGTMRRELYRWVNPDQYGNIFNAENDSLDLKSKRFMAFDFTHIFEDETLAPAVISYIMHRIQSETGETGVPSLIMIDETAPMLKHPMFRDYFIIGLQEGRKKRQAYLCAFQQPNIIDKLGVGEVIRGQCQTVIFFRNPQAMMEDYANWNLTQSELDFVFGKTYRDFPYAILLSRPATGESVILDVNLGALGPYLKLYNSGRKNVLLVEELIKEYGEDNFVTKYLNMA